MRLDRRAVAKAVSESAEVARLLVDLADDVPRARGLLHRAARILVTHQPAVEDGCQRCAGPVDRNRRGRPRKYCTTCSPRKKREKG